MYIYFFYKGINISKYKKIWHLVTHCRTTMLPMATYNPLSAISSLTVGICHCRLQATSANCRYTTSGGPPSSAIAAEAISSNMPHAALPTGYRQLAAVDHHWLIHLQRLSLLNHRVPMLDQQKKIMVQNSHIGLVKIREPIF